MTSKLGCCGECFCCLCVWVSVVSFHSETGREGEQRSGRPAAHNYTQTLTLSSRWAMFSLDPVKKLSMQMTCVVCAREKKREGSECGGDGWAAGSSSARARALGPLHARAPRVPSIAAGRPRPPPLSPCVLPRPDTHNAHPTNARGRPAPPGTCTGGSRQSPRRRSRARGWPRCAAWP
jgi:hypothetical protein